MVEQYKLNMVLSSTMEGCILPAAWHAGILLLFSEASKGERFPFSHRKNEKGEVLLNQTPGHCRGGPSDVCDRLSRGLACRITVSQ